jgi:hypothetical protein
MVSTRRAHSIKRGLLARAPHAHWYSGGMLAGCDVFPCLVALLAGHRDSHFGAGADMKRLLPAEGPVFLLRGFALFGWMKGYSPPISAKL